MQSSCVREKEREREREREGERVRESESARAVDGWWGGCMVVGGCILALQVSLALFW